MSPTPKTSPKTFSPLDSNEEINRANKIQKAIFTEMNSKSGGELTRQRETAYLVRWREALVHVSKGAKVLDIGGGWPIPSIWQSLMDEYGLDYWIHDIDPDIVAMAQTRFAARGVAATQASCGPNTLLPHAANQFDVVFSSHCIEHSSNIVSTFTEITRVIKRAGSLIFAVPFGFDNSDEHLFFLDINGWIAATELAGFDVVNYHVGKTYPMAGWDLLIIANISDERVPDYAALDALVRAHDKQGKTFLLPSDQSFSYSGNVFESEPHRILMTTESTAILDTGGQPASLLFLTTPWSGAVELTDGTTSLFRDLWSRIDYVHAVDVSAMRGPVTVKLLGRSHANFHAVIYGALTG